MIRYLTGVEDLEKTEIGELLRDYGWIGELGDDKLTVAIHKNPPRVTTRSSRPAERPQPDDSNRGEMGRQCVRLQDRVRLAVSDGT